MIHRIKILDVLKEINSIKINCVVNVDAVTSMPASRDQVMGCILQQAVYYRLLLSGFYCQRHSALNSYLR